MHKEADLIMEFSVIRVLVVDDSPVAREYLVHIFESDPAIEVIGTAKDGGEAVKLAGELRPDVITMDINMPVMNGLEATRKIMETYPAPIVIVSGIWDPKEVETTFRAIEAGALAIVQRPAGIGHPRGERMKGELISKVKLMSEVKVVRRWARLRQAAEEKPAAGQPVLDRDRPGHRRCCHRGFNRWSRRPPDHPFRTSRGFPGPGPDRAAHSGRLYPRDGGMALGDERPSAPYSRGRRQIAGRPCLFCAGRLLTWAWTRVGSYVFAKTGAA